MEADSRRTLLAALPIGAIILGPDGRCESVNELAAELLGAGTSSLLHSDLHAFDWWRDSGLQAAVADTMSAGRPFDVRVQAASDPGKNLCLQCHLRRIDLGGSAGVLLTLEDATQCISTRQELELTRLSIDKAADLIHWIAPDGRLLHASDSNCTRLGYTHEEFIALTIFDLDPNMTPEAWSAHWKNLKCHGTVTFERTHLTKTGEAFPLEVTANFVEHEGNEYNFAYARDITERKMAEEALRASEVRYRAMFEGNPNPMWVFDEDTLRFLSVNDAAIAQYGYSRDEFLSMTMGEIRPTEDIPHLLDAIAKAKKAPGTNFSEACHRKRDGTLIDVEITSHLLDVDGTRARLVMLYDVTERKHAGEALRAQQQVTEGIINAIPARVFWKDTNLVYLGCNAAFARDAGFADPKDIIGKDDYEMGWCAQADLYRSDDRLVIEAGCPRLLVEEPQTTPAGDTITLLTSKIPLCNSQGEVSGVLGTYLDITERKQSQEALRQSEHLLREAQAVASLGSYVLDISTGVWRSSEVLDSVFGIDHAYDRSVEGWLALVHPGDRAMMFDHFSNEVLGRDRAFDKEYRIVRCNDQAERWVHGLGRLDFDDQGRPVKMFGTIQDISWRKRAEESLQQAAQRYENVTNTAMDAFWAADLEGRILEVNEASLKMYGYSREEMLDLHIADLDADESPEVMREHQRQITAQGEARFEARHRRRDGTIFEVEVSARAWAPEGPTGSFIRDISERKQAETVLRVQAQTDELTQLPNRRAFVEEVEGSLAEPSPRVALLILDLDRFKEINDSLGHPAGDRLLGIIGARLTGALRASDTLARLGGDEFAVLVRGGALAESEAIARRLQDTLKQPFHLQGMLLPVSASIGIAIAPEHGSRAEELLARADIAMYRAKRLHTGVEVFAAGEGDHGRDRLEFQVAFHAALEREELVLHYQPMIDLADGRVVGAEALVRWDRPGHGLMPPDRFLPLAQETGMMGRITAFVLGQALADCRSWRDRGHDVSVSVNVSAANLVDAGLPDTVLSLLASGGVPPQALVLEITEDTLMADQARAVAVLERLHAAGVRISIDDYGTGFTSLAYLHDLPVDELKLDRSFIADLLENPAHEAIVASTIGLAHVLMLEVVAEGIEDAAVLTHLREIGCHRGQGYHILRPGPVGQFLAYLEESRSLAVIPGR